MIFKQTLPVIHMQKHYPVTKSICQRFILFLITAVLILLMSCTATRKSLYFQNLPNDTVLHNLVVKDFQLKIKKGDIINIGVTGLSPEAAALFTAPQASGGISGF